LLQKTIKPKEIVAVAYYALESAPEFGYPERLSVFEEE
jgi:hypothetical protein